jgi:hypothetical protein
MKKPKDRPNGSPNGKRSRRVNSRAGQIDAQGAKPRPTSFAKLSGRATVKMTTDEIIKLTPGH